MDDEADRRILDIMGDVQALNDYLHGSSSKLIDEDDVTNAVLGSASSFFTSSIGNPSSALKDHTNHIGATGGAGLPIHGSLQFMEGELGVTSPSSGELGEEQPFDILQKSLQEANITEQTLAQEALLESPSLTAPLPQFGGVPVLQAVESGHFPGVPPQGFVQQAAPQPLQNGLAGHFQILGSFNGPQSMMTINGLEPPQILLRPGRSVSPGLGGDVLVQRQVAHAGTVQGAIFSPATGGQVSVPFKRCKTPIPLQNIIIRRGPSPPMLVKPIQPKSLQLGGQTVYNISGLDQQPHNAQPICSPYINSSSTLTPQQMTVNIVNQPVLPSSLALTPGTTMQALNSQLLHTKLQDAADPTSSNTTYSGTFLTNQSATVQLVSGQNFVPSGPLIVNHAVLSGQAAGVHPKNQRRLTSSSPPALTPVQSAYTLVNSSDAGQVAEYTPQPQGLQGPQQVSVSFGHHFLVPLAQDGANTRAHGTNGAQFEIQTCHQSQVAHSLSLAPIQPQLQAQPQLGSLLGTKAGKRSIDLETVVCLPNQVGSPQVPNAQISKMKRTAPPQFTKAELVLQRLRQDQARANAGGRSPFTSLDDAVDRLLPYHVFQGALPSDDDFQRVDEEFEAVAMHVLKRTEALLNKYRRLLLADAECISPSSEMVMIDRTFNQEEQSSLTQDKRLMLVDPDRFLEDFCCLPKPMDVVHTQGVPEEQCASVQAPDGLSLAGEYSACAGQGWEGWARDRADPSLRTEPQPGSKDPGGEQPEVSLSVHLETAIKSNLQLKRTQGHSFNANTSPALPAPLPSSAPCSPPDPQGQGSAKPLPPDYSQPLLADTDSALEAAVNSILEF